MSHTRFIRCPHCRMPHEAGAESCSVTGLALPKSKKKRIDPPPSGPDWPETRASQPPPSPYGDAITVADLAKGLGDRLLEGKYRVDRRIGKGAMGAVYAAEHVHLDKKVAIKVLYRERGLKPTDVHRFLREARIAGSLGHPHIVQVFDLGSLGDGAPYLVMDLLEGETLADRLAIDGAISPAAMIQIADEVLSALSAAHERGVVHRDMKPDNIFLTKRPHMPEVAKLLDFGVSKTLDDNTLTLTRTGAVVGTPYYLAPEQARGEGEIDHRVDIWGVGVVLYESVTGMMPFNAKSYGALLTKILSHRPDPPSHIRPGVGPALEEVILKALAYDPEDRFQTAEAMREALEGAAAEAEEEDVTATAVDVSTELAAFCTEDEIPGEVTVFDGKASAVHEVDEEGMRELPGERTIPEALAGGERKKGSSSG